MHLGSFDPDNYIYAVTYQEGRQPGSRGAGVEMRGFAHKFFNSRDTVRCEATDYFVGTPGWMDKIVGTRWTSGGRGLVRRAARRGRSRRRKVATGAVGPVVDNFVRSSPRTNIYVAGNCPNAGAA